MFNVYLQLVLLIDIRKSGYRILDPISGYENNHTIIENECKRTGSVLCAGCLDTVKRFVH